MGLDTPRFLKRLENRINSLFRRIGILESSEGGGTAAATTVDDTNLKSFVGTNVQDIIEFADIGFTNARSTGLGTGGNLTDLGLGVVRITAGAGSIIANPNYTQLAWVQTDIDLSVADVVSYIYVDATNAVLSTTVAPTNADYRTKVYLWRVSIRGGVLVGKLPIPQPLQQAGPQLRDIFVAVGQKKTGLTITAAGANLSFAYGTGSIYFPGANFYIDPDNPHEVTIPAVSPVTFQHVDQNNIRTANTTLLDVGNYDLGGVITAIPGSTSRASIFSVFLSPVSKNVRVVYGQIYYGTVGAAFTALNSGTYSPIIPNQIETATIQIGWIIASKGATNLGDGTQIFITANRDGSIGGAISSTGASPLLAANNLSDLLDPAAAKTILTINNVSNTSDSAKPVSVAQQAALDLKANSIAPTLTNAVNTVTAPGVNSVGYLGVPQNSKSAAYTLVLTDASKHILHPSVDTTARIFTIPANASVAFPVGTTVTFANQNGGGAITITITTDTMRLAGAGTTGSRTLTANGIATALKLTATEWLINGVNLT